MKKLIFLLIFLSFQSVVQAQFSVGINAIAQFPHGYYKNISDFGYGASASVGYSLTQRIDLSLIYSIYDYTGPINAFKLNSKTAEVRFFLLNGNTRPYLGCGVGIFSETFNSPPIPKQTENKWGVEPKAGIQLKSGIVKNLYIDTYASWLRADLKQRGPNAINLSGGLKYFIDIHQ